MSSHRKKPIKHHFLSAFRPVPNRIGLEPTKELSAIYRYSYLLMVAWVAIVMGSLWWNWHLQDESMQRFALAEAQSAFVKDMVYRQWVSNQGGVYVVMTDSSQVNPYLSHLPNRDLVTTDGVNLTLVNPAFMTRQVNELGNERFGLKGHITSLRLLRPENAPDEWERKVLTMFEQGVDEYSNLDTEDGRQCVRYMKALHDTPECMKCHGGEAFSQAGIRGGLSVSVPLERYQAYWASFFYGKIPVHAALLVLGLVFIVVGRRRMMRYALDTSNALKDARDKEEALVLQNNEIIMKNRKLDEMHGRLAVKNLQLQAFNKLTAGILSAVSEDEFFDVVGDITQKILDIPYMSIYSASSAEGMPRTIVQRGELPNGGMSGADHGGCCPLSGDKPENPLQMRTGNCAFHQSSWAWMPLSVRGQIWGWMIFISNEMYKFDSSDMQSFLRRLAYQVGAGIQTIFLRKEKMDEEAQVLQENYDLTLLNSSKNRFFSVVAHDLKNPFNVIMGLSDVLRKGYRTFDDEKMKLIIDNLHDATSKTAHLLDNLLEWGRIQLEELRFEPERQNLRSVAEQSLADVELLARQKGVTIVNRINKKIDIMADSYIARSVFRNLLSNSVKFSFFGGKVWVDAKTEGDWVRCSVTDRGVGVEHDKVKNLFRVDEKMSTIGTFGEKGSGLGLVLCREFIEKHGGEIYIEHPSAGGLRVVFTLPALAGDGYADEGSASIHHAKVCLAIP
ncbi:signal transduction histidine kinase [Breznakibacter xylanolyticus]|uniref:histidine kinase n=1 Tax=Breznakibacter xylanolyticus TaxID=990 RepID=A0A2W7N4Y7_9BACT|nr:ATP-binding protein [Breznakibacter xylanolyticus]PZX15141.1 signal transduction histidine kinase [Breznakibacter xylanolyticus]